MARSVLVTGGGGFIGKVVVARLMASRNYSVSVLTRRPIDEFASGEWCPTQIIGDLVDPVTYRKDLKGVDIVIHLAAATGRAAPAEYRRVNVEGTRTLLAACKAEGVHRFVHMSTIAAAYSDQSYYHYAKTKSQAEALVRESGLEYAIVRPTVVLGAGSPIWDTLLKIAKLPVIPLPEGRRPVMVGPVNVDDVARAVEVLVESGRLGNETLEIGGRDRLPFREFLELIQRALRGRSRVVSVPLGPIRALLAVMEPIARPVMPVTAGQLAIFANDSVAAENWLLARIRADMPSTSETIATLLGSTDAKPPGTNSPSRPLSTDSRRALDTECRSFAIYLVGMPSSAYVADQYVAAVLARGLASDAEFSCVDRAMLRLARRGPMFTRWADAYCAIFARRSVLRRRLIVMAAILEHVVPANEAVDRVEPQSAVRTVASLAGHGIAFTVSLVLGAMILLPTTVLCRLVGKTHGAVAAGTAK